MKQWIGFFLLGAVFAFCGAQAVPPQSRIDGLVLAKQAETGFPPSELCTDDVFIRRVFLDVIGTLPTAKEVREFSASPKPDKRRLLIDYVLDREEFAAYQSLKWCDLLRVKSEFPGNLWPNAVQAYQRWVRDAFRQNMPYDRFARALLTTSGSNFRDPPVNFYRPFQERTPRKILDSVALIFMGVRLETSGWTEEQLQGMDAFFAKVAYKKTAEWKEEIVYSDPEKVLLNPQTKEPVLPTPIGGVPLKLDHFADPRVAFADWLTAPENPWFAKAIANRVWFWLMGRGIVHEADDIRPGNPPWSPELLAYLEKELVQNKYDLKHLFRLILNSATYQRSSVPTSGNAADEAGFSHYRVRRLDAEVLIDAINQITGSGEEYSSAIPEPFTYIPPSQRTITLADGSIKSPFLEMFGRPGRDTSLESDRNNNPSVFQTLHLLNSSHIQNKIMKGYRLRKMADSIQGNRERVVQLYLTILSRMPSAGEEKIALGYIESSERADDGFYDVAWALINSSEFILKH
ncbi:MAG: DUF1549 and DUF1553 domain-containing protein [Pontiellaceae bacterium]|nr:DUF1549 and DUF1553 domain-containing protein [Pontiellaceae bacterium]